MHPSHASRHTDPGIQLLAITDKPPHRSSYPCQRHASPLAMATTTTSARTHGHQHQQPPYVAALRYEPLRRMQGLDLKTALRASPRASTAATAALVVPLGGALMGASGLALAVTMTGLALAAPLLVLFSPVRGGCYGLGKEGMANEMATGATSGGASHSFPRGGGQGALVGRGQGFNPGFQLGFTPGYDGGRGRYRGRGHLQRGGYGRRGGRRGRGRGYNYGYDDFGYDYNGGVGYQELHGNGTRNSMVMAAASRPTTPVRATKAFTEGAMDFMVPTILLTMGVVLVRVSMEDVTSIMEGEVDTTK
ncbi:unnamed protein product [Urochloa humidicola]